MWHVDQMSTVCGVGGLGRVPSTAEKGTRCSDGLLPFQNEVIKLLFDYQLTYNLLPFQPDCMTQCLYHLICCPGITRHTSVSNKVCRRLQACVLLDPYQSLTWVMLVISCKVSSSELPFVFQGLCKTHCLQTTPGSSGVLPQTHLPIQRVQ